MSTSKYLMIQASKFEAKGDQLIDRGQNEKAQYWYMKAVKLERQAAEQKKLEPESGPLRQKRLFESDYDNLPDEDEFEDGDSEIEDGYCWTHKCYEDECEQYHDGYVPEYGNIILAWLAKHNAVPVAPDKDPEHVEIRSNGADVSAKFWSELKSELDGFTVMEPGSPAKIIIHSSVVDQVHFDGKMWSISSP